METNPPKLPYKMTLDFCRVLSYELCNWCRVNCSKACLKDDAMPSTSILMLNKWQIW